MLSLMAIGSPASRRFSGLARSRAADAIQPSRMDRLHDALAPPIGARRLALVCRPHAACDAARRSAGGNFHRLYHAWTSAGLFCSSVSSCSRSPSTQRAATDEERGPLLAVQWDRSFLCHPVVWADGLHRPSGLLVLVLDFFDLPGCTCDVRADRPASGLCMSCLKCAADESWQRPHRRDPDGSGRWSPGSDCLSPDWVNMLRSLDRPLNFAPATETMLFALRTYAGVSLDIGRASYLMGALLLASGFAIWFRSRGAALTVMPLVPEPGSAPAQDERPDRTRESR